MSRVYFHGPSGTAELHGSERAWLDHVASGPAMAAWDLDRFDALDRAAQILAMVPEVPDGEYGANYLHTYLRQAQAARARDAHHQHQLAHQLMSALRTKLEGFGTPLVVADVELHSRDVGLNTSLVAGSDPVRLAAKIHGLCEVHGWVEGPDRAWLAGIIDQGLEAGIFRRELWFADHPDGPKDRWSDQGWEQVRELLLARADEPVVMSYSVTDGFPNQDIADWTPPQLPDGWRPVWATDHHGGEEWKGLPPEDREKYRREEQREAWGWLDAAEQWQRAVAGLRRDRPWARIAPDTLAAQMFHLPVTVYDLLAQDRDEKVRAAAGRWAAV